jgi:hypothetical protein
MKPRKDARAKPCPECGAREGEYCRRHNGRRRFSCHAARHSPFMTTETEAVKRQSTMNRAAVKKRALSKAQQRAWKPTQVRKSFLDRIEARLNAIIDSEVMSHPSKGKSLT